MPLGVVLPVLLLVAQVHDELIEAICKPLRGRRPQLCASTCRGRVVRIAGAGVAGGPETTRQNQAGRYNRNKEKRSSPIPKHAA